VKGNGPYTLRVRPTSEERRRMLMARASSEASSVKMKGKLTRTQPSLPRLKCMEEKL